MQLPIPGLSKGSSDGIVYLAPFFDWGWAESKDRPTPDPRTISGVGLGLRWDPTSKIQANIYYGYALRKIDRGSDNKDLPGFRGLLPGNNEIFLITMEG